MKLLQGDSSIKPEVKQQRSTNFSNFVLCEHDHSSILEKIQEKSRIFEQFIAEGVALQQKLLNSSSEENKSNFQTDDYLQEYASGLFKSSSDDINLLLSIEDSTSTPHVRFDLTADGKTSGSEIKSPSSSFYSLTPSTAPAVGSRGTLFYSKKKKSSSKDSDGGNGQINSPSSSIDNDDDDDGAV